MTIQAWLTIAAFILGILFAIIGFFIKGLITDLKEHAARVQKIEIRVSLVEAKIESVEKDINTQLSNIKETVDRIYHYFFPPKI